MFSGFGDVSNEKRSTYPSFSATFVGCAEVKVTYAAAYVESQAGRGKVVRMLVSQ